MKRTGFKSRGKPLTAKRPMRKVSKKKSKHRASADGKPRGGSKLTQNAKGKPCTLRLNGCRHDPAYTVFAHYRRFSWGGMGLKPVDVLGCFACDVCHDKQERRDPECTDADLLRAMGETLLIQIDDGLISLA